MSYAKRFSQYKMPDSQSRPRWVLPVVAGVGVIAVVVVAALLILSSRQPAFVPLVKGAPSAQFNQTKTDLGTIKLGQTVRSEFIIRNVGDKALTITNQPKVEVLKGCCPPDVQLTTHTLWPGQEAKISTQFMMHEGMGGEHEFRIHIETNDPKQPQQDLIILSNWVA